MTRKYQYIELTERQIPKKAGLPSGDIILCERKPEHTTLLLCDGMGHGVKANIAAQLFSSRFMELCSRGFSFQNAFFSLVKSSEEAKLKELPYCAFTAVRVLNDGLCSFLSYEAPTPIIVNPRYAAVMETRARTRDRAVVNEGNCYLTAGEGILLFSDGISQAGLGRGLPYGWGEKGVEEMLSLHLAGGAGLETLPAEILKKALSLWGPAPGDDCSVVLAKSREGVVVNLFTGPPSDPSKDKEVFCKFFRTPGIHIICGGTTAKIAARVLGREVEMERNPLSLITPPRMSIAGVDLVTEGAVTLNQIYNILEEDPSRFDEKNAATDLYSLLHAADRVNLTMGRAENPAGSHISFRQKGILTREIILPMLAEKLKKLGKLVVLEQV